MVETLERDLVVIGGGVGGYSAAFRAADLGKRVTLIERRSVLGGTCLNVGCIPSKALLHMAEVVEEVANLSPYGLNFSGKNIDAQKIVDWKKGIIKRLNAGLSFLAQKRDVEVIYGQASFIDHEKIKITNSEREEQIISYKSAIIAAGSSPRELKSLPNNDPRIINSTTALELPKVDGEMLILGGGIIGLEMATIYRSLGVKVTIVEMMSQLIPECDADLVEPLYKRLKRDCGVILEAKVNQVQPKTDGLWVHFEGKESPMKYDQILVSIGRYPDVAQLGLENINIKPDEKGFITVDDQMRTNIENIFAIGDVVGQPMLAHKASYEGRLAAEIIGGLDKRYGEKIIPSVAYTDPEIAWVGLTEKEAKRKGVLYKLGKFPWLASSRALTLNRAEGFTKILFDPKTDKVLGAGIAGVDAGNLISELTLAIKLGATAQQVAETIHPHPTLSETIMIAAEVFEGTATDIYAPKTTIERSAGE